MRLPANLKTARGGKKNKKTRTTAFASHLFAFPSPFFLPAAREMHNLQQNTRSTHDDWKCRRRARSVGAVAEKKSHVQKGRKRLRLSVRCTRCITDRLWVFFLNDTFPSSFCGGKQVIVALIINYNKTGILLGSAN